MEPGNGIEVRGLVREYKKGPRAVDGIDLAVDPGEIYGFLGPNGAGKSTTVHVLTTLLPPTAGTALVAGYDVVNDGPKIRGLIGVALQAYLYRTAQDVESLLPLGAAIRMVKGAYLEPAGVAYPKKADVDQNFYTLSCRLMSEEAQRAGGLLHIAQLEASVVGIDQGRRQEHPRP